MGKHGKTVERLIVGDAFQASAVDIHHVQVKITSGFAAVIGSKNNAFVIRMEKRRKAGNTQMGNLFHVLTIRIHYVNFQRGRPVQVLFYQYLIIRQFLRGFGPAGTEDNLFPIPGEKCTAIIALFKSKALLVTAIQIHHINFRVPIPGGGKYNFIPGRRNRCFGVVSRGIRQPLDDFPIRKARQKNIKRTVQLPHIPVFPRRRWRAFVTGQMGGGIKESTVTG